VLQVIGQFPALKGEAAALRWACSE
jgi:hypothetical protein